MRDKAYLLSRFVETVGKSFRRTCQEIPQTKGSITNVIGTPLAHVIASEVSKKTRVHVKDKFDLRRKDI